MKTRAPITIFFLPTLLVNSKFKIVPAKYNPYVFKHKHDLNINLYFK